jgi:hypothetical protein
MVKIGCMNVARSHKKLPNDIQKFLDDATDGAVYAEIPQRVVWKCESEYMPGQPKNVN